MSEFKTRYIQKFKIHTIIKALIVHNSITGVKVVSRFAIVRYRRFLRQEIPLLKKAVLYVLTVLNIKEFKLTSSR